MAQYTHGGVKSFLALVIFTVDSVAERYLGFLRRASMVDFHQMVIQWGSCSRRIWIESEMYLLHGCIKPPEKESSPNLHPVESSIRGDVEMSLIFVHVETRCLVLSAKTSLWTEFSDVLMTHRHSKLTQG